MSTWIISKWAYLGFLCSACQIWMSVLAKVFLTKWACVPDNVTLKLWSFDLLTFHKPTSIVNEKNWRLEILRVPVQKVFFARVQVIKTKQYFMQRKRYRSLNDDISYFWVCILFTELPSLTAVAELSIFQKNMFIPRDYNNNQCIFFNPLLCFYKSIISMPSNLTK